MSTVDPWSMEAAMEGLNEEPTIGDLIAAGVPGIAYCGAYGCKTRYRVDGVYPGPRWYTDRRGEPRQALTHPGHPLWCPDRSHKRPLLYRAIKYTHKPGKKCTDSCKAATGWVCVCSCGLANHGILSVR